jgi:hydrogenase nickel incorporation protein HypA/HybF
MHELALGRAILQTALAHAGGRRVRRVRVSVGALRQASPASLSFYFELLARGTACEQAVLEARPQPARLRCPCGTEWEPSEPSFLCPACGGAGAEIVSGEQLMVEEIEVEEVAGCTARR